jgi:hypothetical protein
MAQIAATLGTGLKVPSVVRFDKVATLDRSVIAGKLGVAPAAWLSAHRTTFQSVSGLMRWVRSRLNPCLGRGKSAGLEAIGSGRAAGSRRFAADFSPFYAR